jgi:protocatechuate 3,4-dioxygenase beta subunit
MTSLQRLFCFFLILTTVILFQSPESVRGQSPDKLKGAGSISGRITLAGKPALGVIVAAISGGETNQRRAARATTDSEGRYRLFGLAAGTYQVAALAAALVSPLEANNNYSYGKTVLLSTAEAVEDVDLKLLRGGVVTGRITDEDGRPVIEERVNLDPVADQTGRPPAQMSPYLNLQMYQTDDRGVYRIYGLPAGRYKVSVGSATGGFLRNGARGSFAQTFYGDTNDAAKATIVELGEGSEAASIDIRLGRRGATFSIAGRVVNSENGEPLAGVRPTYGRISRTDPNSSAFIGGLPTNSRGEFRFEGLEPGHYTIYVSSRYEAGDFYSEPLVFDVVDHDVTNLELKALRGFSISGVVVPETGSGKLSLLGGWRITAGVRTNSNPPTNSFGVALIEADGSFRINGLSPGRVSLYLYSQDNPNSRRISVTRIERDGVDQTPGFDLPAGQSISNLRVVVSSGTGVIRGTVRFENGSPPPNVQMHVGIRRDGEERPLDRGAITDTRGRFLITGLAAGNYEITLNLVVFGPQVQPPPPARPPLKQFVSVAADSEVEVTFTVDLKAKAGGP